MKGFLEGKLRLDTNSFPSALRSPLLHLTVFLVYSCYALQTVARLDGLRDTLLDRLIGRDFVNFWSAARFLLEDRLSLLYDLEAFHAAQEVLIGQSFGWHFWSYPPLSLPFILPLGFLPYIPAYLLWSALGLALYALSLRFLSRSALPLLCLVTLSPASLENITAGQNGFFTSALLVTGLRLMTAHPALSGICFGLMAIKPQLAVFVPFVLLAARAWKTIGYTALTVLILGSVSVFLYGTTPWIDYVQNTMGREKLLIENDRLFLFSYLIPSPFYALRINGLSVEIAKAVQMFVSLLCAGGVYYLFRKTQDIRLQIAVYGAAVFLATPYALNYDMPLLAAACLALATTTTSFSFNERTVLVAAWLLPLYLELANRLHMTIGPVVLAGVLALATKQILSASDRHHNKDYPSIS